MPRPVRYQPAGGTSHITSRGNRSQAIFIDDHDRELFLRLYRRVLSEAAWRQLGWCLMSNHFHLIVTTPTESLSRGMHHLNGLYARRFNARHSFQGHLFERRYDARFIDGEEQLGNTVSYIAMNPVNAGLCASPADWKWCNYYGAARDFVFHR
jgi:REP element-mobilizing transposase RayT